MILRFLIKNLSKHIFFIFLLLFSFFPALVLNQKLLTSSLITTPSLTVSIPFNSHLSYPDLLCPNLLHPTCPNGSFSTFSLFIPFLYPLSSYLSPFFHILTPFYLSLFTNYLTSLLPIFLFY